MINYKLIKMKKNIYITLFAVFAFFGCETREEAELALSQKDLPVMNVSIEGDSFFDLTNLDASRVTLKIEATGEVSSVKVFKSFSDPDSTTILLEEVSSFPATLEISVSDAIEGFDLIKEDLEPGDNFFFSLEAVVNGNPVTYSGSAVSITSACPSAIPEGMWTGVNNDSGNFGTTSSNPEVTITSLGGGQYSVSDVSGGAYFACCSSGGFVRDQGVTIMDVCNTISVIGSAASQVNIGQDFSSLGSWNPATGELVINWCDNSNSFCSTTTFTKN
jgi:hypothetical protein